VGGRAPAVQRQRAGARGGRAARNSARRRINDTSSLTDPTSTASPATTAYSEYGDYQSYEYNDLQPAVRSWPMTPVDDHITPEEANLLNYFAAYDAMDAKPQYITYTTADINTQKAPM
jgi:hypothetical protein